MKRSPHIAHYLLAALLAWLPLQAYAGGMLPAGGSEDCAAMAMQAHHGHHPGVELPSAGQGEAAPCCAGCDGACDHCAACTLGAVAAIAAAASRPMIAAAAATPNDITASMSSRSPVPRLRPPRHA